MQEVRISLHVTYNIRGHTHTLLECWRNSSGMVRRKDQGRSNGHVEVFSHLETTAVVPTHVTVIAVHSMQYKAVDAVAI